MDRTHLQEPRTYQYLLLAAGAVLVSVATALGVVFLLRRRSPSLHQPADGGNRQEGAAPGGSREEDPIQPAVDTIAPAQVPHHFTETLLVPGYTFTGEQILEQDDADGRSAEGV